MINISVYKIEKYSEALQAFNDVIYELEQVDYLDENGDVRIPAQSSSLPAPDSGSDGGSFAGGSDGTVTHPMTFNENITSDSSQGLDPTTAADGLDDYITALKLLNNQDEYDFNLL